ncbi:ImmA/IrrE family metallo-endopeptidase [Mameliella sediminis]|uniref:ImmA/IrrE family metallo-endopeptidase n=1 Tax=Mameliella sediminis TaxID=2836866 RepID=UPI001C45260E|nr:ImmA/IrrE family metallo-endopeptidase [Mameliella sediminis]MBY6115008.1 ImmA/IrrE family metallo-endopeptidase [Antarctobacter heliothermus]MBY6145107.1 ImmA/IrrE family metallo-endopeptidase [Mameliella alba]MBV7396214.1 ImmA/IrrE family metallo-endopeptidase [Mameliella sediminis]MBY6160624.1 ImmA/IrrE family metallo-endopeptidase [Mameliella alba]MBY6169094.1 ImmA/IrrE family metallo-endopeptidase [Mameliella alba]
MPPRYPSYPYVEPLATGVSDVEIEDVINDMIAQSPGLSLPHGESLDPICRALNVDLEYSGPPHEILLDVPLNRKACIWLPKRGKPRQDRFMAAMGVGHWILHVPSTREAHPRCGIQALHQPASRAAQREAVRFARILLMPRDEFCSLWYEGRANLVADTLNVPTQVVYERATMLDLPVEDTGGNKFEWKERGQVSTGF